MLNMNYVRFLAAHLAKDLKWKKTWCPSFDQCNISLVSAFALPAIYSDPVVWARSTEPLDEFACVGTDWRSAYHYYFQNHCHLTAVIAEKR